MERDGLNACQITLLQDFTEAANLFTVFKWESVAHSKRLDGPCAVRVSGAAPLIMLDGLGLARQAVMPSSLDSSVPRHTPSTQLTLRLIVALSVATKLDKVM